MHHPAVVDEFQQRASDVQLRIADRITSFAGSMNFVYVHIMLFALWMLVLERSPWPTLTLIVSLEAIFLSTFVMIGQNRQGAFQQAKADHDFNEQELELKTNTKLTREIHRSPPSRTWSPASVRDRQISVPSSPFAPTSKVFIGSSCAPRGRVQQQVARGQRVMAVTVTVTGTMG